MNILKIVVAILVVFPITPASALTETSAEFAMFCNIGESEKAVCTAFVAGVVSGFVQSQDYLRLELDLEATPRMFCPPEDWSAGRGLDIILEWVSSNPDHAEFDPAGLLLWSHKIAFPCE